MILGPQRVLIMPPRQRKVPRGSLVADQEADQGPEYSRQSKAEQRRGKAEPRGQQSHQFGVAQADALAPPHQPIRPANRQDKQSGGEDAEEIVDGK